MLISIGKRSLRSPGVLAFIARIVGIAARPIPSSRDTGMLCDHLRRDIGLSP